MKLEATSQQIARVYLTAKTAGDLRAALVQAARGGAIGKDVQAMEKGVDYEGSAELQSSLCDKMAREKYALQTQLQNCVIAHIEDQFLQFDCQFFKSFRESWDDAQAYAYIPSSVEPKLQEIRDKFGRGSEPGRPGGPESH